ncbi:hypothetical protein ACFUJX_22890 [Streptomyces rubiginosohelvolus]|uniref:hypothetical protein n=1 Tax=Streptomyces rubiginosohelvolus TaxID=67362 RepID=UPI003628BC75
MLADMDGVAHSVVTGNIRAVAAIKPQVFGRHIAFPYGCGEDHGDRAELVRIAIARIREATGSRLPGGYPASCSSATPCQT